MPTHSVFHHAQNRRRSLRYPVGWRARITIRGRETFEVQLADVSEDGIQFFSRERFRSGELVEMDVFTSWRSFFRSSATIVRIGRKSAMGQEYGIRFARLSDIDRAVLVAGLRNLGGGSTTQRGMLLTGTAA